jgi:hypothetical protein
MPRGPVVIGRSPSHLPKWPAPTCSSHLHAHLDSFFICQKNAKNSPAVRQNGAPIPCPPIPSRETLANPTTRRGAGGAERLSGSGGGAEQAAGARRSPTRAAAGRERHKAAAADGRGDDAAATRGGSGSPAWGWREAAAAVTVEHGDPYSFVRSPTTACFPTGGRRAARVARRPAGSTAGGRNQGGAAPLELLPHMVRVLAAARCSVPGSGALLGAWQRPPVAGLPDSLPSVLACQ